jgi:hypothetical protein
VVPPSRCFTDIHVHLAPTPTTRFADNDRVCTPCQPGTFYNPTSGGRCDTCQLSCPEGQAVTGDCSGTGISSNPLSCTSCAPGTYTASGSYTWVYNNSNNRCLNCGVGYSCPQTGSGSSGTTARYPCSNTDQYQNSTTATTCLSVSAGYYTTPAGNNPHSGQMGCESGFYCTGGVRAACSGVNEYQPATLQTSCAVVGDG